MYLGEPFWKRLTSELVTIPNVGVHRPTHWRPEKNQQAEEGWMTSIWMLQLRYPSSSCPWPSWLSGLLTQWKWSCSVVSDSLRLVDCSPPSSSVHGILQARILEWVAISFSRRSSRPRDRTQVSHIAGRCFNLCTTREALKYKNTVSQKTSYRDTELQIQVLTSEISREERKSGWKKGEEVGWGGGERGGLTLTLGTEKFTQGREETKQYSWVAYCTWGILAGLSTCFGVLEASH